MQFENKTIEEIRDLIINAVENNFNIAFRLLPKSFLFTLATVLAGVYVTCYKQIAWVFLQIFPESAYWQTVTTLGMPIRPLVKWGVLIGVGEPRQGTQWKGKITVTVAHTGSILVSGTQLKSNITGCVYITEESIPLHDDTASVPVICADIGPAGNLEKGDALFFVTPLGNVQRTVIVESVSAYGQDSESETEYRERVVRRFRSPPLGGALSDYQIWASSVPGVLGAYPYGDPDSAAGVLVYVAGVPAQFPRRVPTEDLLRQVGHACTYDPVTGRANRKPITAVIDPAFDGTYKNIRPVSIKNYTVHINGISGMPVTDFTNAVKPAIESYFLGREPYIRGLSDDNNRLDTISRNNITSVVDQISISIRAEFESVSLERDGITVSSEFLDMGELAELTQVFVNEALAA
ncbi:MAG: baseplate J/gp47 family protein [Treponema sp.]|nr:baseplate J/gp47 family protein [Treponema sp.]